ncbi:MAG: hemolysin family protein [Holosporales bacterium]|jgi:CBS domain containing-hemolysin-like protein|nr:hemolysin family protein [Holosporales bacterium]
MNIKNYLRFLKKIFYKKNQEITVRDTIEELINEEDETSSIDDDEKEMLENVLNLRDIQVQDIMIPRVEIKALSITENVEEFISMFVEEQISSILVYQGTIDNIIGVVYLKNVANWFRMNKPFNVSIFTKEVLFIPPTMKILDLITQMKDTGTKVAVVVDEYGGVDGFVSFKDLIEEIIGDIQDSNSSKDNKSKIIRNSDDSYTVDARASLEEIEKATEIKIVSKDRTIDSIGGYVFTISGNVPAKGTIISNKTNNMKFEILDADPRRIKLIKIRNG